MTIDEYLKCIKANIVTIEKELANNEFAKAWGTNCILENNVQLMLGKIAHATLRDNDETNKHKKSS